MTIEFNNISCSGEFTTTNDGIVSTFKNLLTDNGRMALFSGTIKDALGQAIIIGSSNAAPTVSNIAMGSAYGYPLEQISFTCSVDPLDNHVINVTNKCGFFNQYGSAVVIKELGIKVNTGTYGNKLSIRTTTKNANGANADVSVAVNQDYIVNYTYKLNLGSSDATGSFIYNGVTYNYRVVTGLIRLAPNTNLFDMSILIGAHSASDIDMYTLSSVDVLANMNLIYSQWDAQYLSTGAYTNLQFTDSGLSGSITSGTYKTESIATNLYTLNAAESLAAPSMTNAECNFIGGIRTLFIGMPIDSVHKNVFGAIMFNPPLPKNSAQPMTINNIIKTRL